MSTRMRLNLPGTLFVVGLLSAATFPSDVPLINAAQQGDVGTVQSLLKQGADPNAAAGDGMTALHWAAERGHQKVIESTRYENKNRGIYTTPPGQSEWTWHSHTSASQGRRQPERNHYY
jgi:hypothetical protein